MHLLFASKVLQKNTLKSKISSVKSSALLLSSLSMTALLHYVKKHAQLYLLTSVWISWWGPSMCSAQRWKKPCLYRVRGFVRPWGSWILLILTVIFSEVIPRLLDILSG